MRRMGLPGMTTTYVYRVWLPPSARRKQREIERLQREVREAEVLVDMKGQPFRFRQDGSRQMLPVSMIPKKFRNEVIASSKGILT